MPNLAFNHRLLRLLVFVAHLAVVAALAFFYFNVDTDTLTRIITIDPVTSLYSAAAINWVGGWREISHIVSAIANAMIAVMMIMFAQERKSEVMKFFLIALAVQLLLAACLNISLFGLIFFGGWWHVLSMFIVGFKAMSLVITASIMFIYRDAFTADGRTQDEAIERLIQEQSQKDS